MYIQHALKKNLSVLYIIGSNKIFMKKDKKNFFCIFLTEGGGSEQKGTGPLKVEFFTPSLDPNYSK